MVLRTFLPALRCGALLSCLLALAVAGAEPPTLVSALDVSITSGALPLPAGVGLDLKIYEQGPVPRIVPIPHGEPWLPGATRLVRVKLERPLDPRHVRRYSIAYRTPQALQAPWEIESAVVEWEAGGRHERLLAATLSGTVAADREVASEDVKEAQMTCAADADCDDGRMCNGAERCDPGNRTADSRGCVSGRPLVCPVNQVCVERAGCRGAAEAAAPH